MAVTRQISDVIVVGAGPGGLALSILLSSEGRSVALFESGNRVGGQIAYSHWVENTPPFSMGFSGQHYSSESYKQCQKFGVDVHLHTPVTSIYKDEETGYFLVNGQYLSHVVVLSVGLSPKPAEFHIDGNAGLGCQIVTSPELTPMNPGDSVVIYGGGNSAGQAAKYYASQEVKVIVMSRRPVVETMSAYLIHELVSWGVQFVTSPIIEVRSMGTVYGEGVAFSPDRLHIFTGMMPDMTWLGDDMVEVDDSGYVVTGYNHMTRTEGLFAVGDCVHGAHHKLQCATGAAAMTVPYIHWYLDERLKGE